ncbi:MAG: AAA family ATPase [bacterium]|nr:AAA family ATPase [bacterium]
MTQEEALTILKTGANVFLTGEPGSGKTHTINQYVSYLREHEIEPAVTASTGIAATHIGGFTIHSWSGIGIRKHMSEYELEMIEMNQRVHRRVSAARVLVIDEISMLDGKTLVLVDRVCRIIQRSEKAFGGMQVIFVGDFFQLPPVTREGDLPLQFAFASESWSVAKPVVCYLSEQHRQEDLIFLEALSALRRGVFGDSHYAQLAKRFVRPEEHAALAVTKLFPHNADVDRLNDAELAKLPDAPRMFRMTSRGVPPLVEQLKRGCLSPETLALKKGARVMFTKNNFEAGFVNGTTGEVAGFRKADGAPVIHTRAGSRIAEPMEWTITDGLKVLAKIEQTPLRLAWAITVHKSQGVSLDAAFMDLSGAFEYGQGYVALSRVRTLAGLYLGGLNDKALRVHPDVLAKDAELRALSDTLREVFRSMGFEEITKLQHDFIRACGGTMGVRKSEKPAKKKEPTLGVTKAFLLKKLQLAEIAAERNLTVGTIIGHLEKLVAQNLIDANRDCAHLKPEQKRFEKAKKAFEYIFKREKTMALSPVRAMLGDDFSFDELRLVRLYM